MKKSVLLLAGLLGLSACASSQPHIIQASSASPEVNLTQGMATQIELPEGRVKSVVVGNPDLLSAEQTDNVVNLVAKHSSGTTNLIIRASEDGDIKVYQYRVTVEAP